MRIPHCVSLSSLCTCVVRARLRASDLAVDGASGVLRLGARYGFPFWDVFFYHGFHSSLPNDVYVHNDRLCLSSACQTALAMLINTNLPQVCRPSPRSVERGHCGLGPPWAGPIPMTARSELTCLTAPAPVFSKTRLPTQAARHEARVG